MKRYAIISLIVVLALLMTACAAAKDPAAVTPQTVNPAQTESSKTETEPETAEVTKLETTEVVTEPETAHATEPETNGDTETGTEIKENSAFTRRFSECSETVLGLLYNDPFSEGDPIPTEIWNEGEYDKLVLIPRYVGSIVSAYRVSWDTDGWMTIADEPSFSSVAVDGTEIGASLERPESMAAWYVSIELPDGTSGGIELNYNGRYGTPLYEFIEDPYLSSLIEVPTSMEDWNPQMEMIGHERFWSFWRAAQRSGEDLWEACCRYYTELSEVGDGAAFTRVEGGDMEGDTFSFRAARFHSAYFAEKNSLKEETAYQYQMYESVGNAYGILGPDREDSGEPLVFRLTGLTVFNPSLSAKQIQVTVNGIDAGTYDLSSEDFCTLIPIELPDFSAEQPISVDVKVISTNYGMPESAIIDVYPGVGGNISGAI